MMKQFYENSAQFVYKEYSDREAQATQELREYRETTNKREVKENEITINKEDVKENIGKEIDYILFRLRELKQTVSEYDAEEALSFMMSSIVKIGDYIDNMPVVFQKLFDDIRTDMLQMKIRYNTIKKDFMHSVINFDPYNIEKNKILQSAFERMKDFERDLSDCKNAFYKEIYNCNTNLESYPIIELTLKLTIGSIDNDFISKLLSEINVSIRIKEDNVAEILMIRPGSTIISLKVPKHSVENVVKMFKEGDFDTFKAIRMVIIHSLSRSEIINRDKRVNWLRYLTISLLLIIIVLLLVFILGI